MVGTPTACAEKILRMGEAGADSVGLRLVPDGSGDAQIDSLSQEMLPLLR